MTIVFLCGSLEPGHDGVGDYTRRLSGELIKQGHQVGILALRDQNLLEEVEETQYSEGIHVKVLRLPGNWKNHRRVKRAEAWITMFNPEWISLQFVIFSFHSKGIPINLYNWLKVLGKGRRWHIMFHELWVGMNVDATLKLFWWGWLQRQIIRKLLLKLRPDVIHTHTQLYQEQLKKIGFPAGNLPLFGNIPYDSSHNSYGINKPFVLNPKAEIKLVHFGSIHPNVPIAKFATEAASYSSEFQVVVSLTIVGRSGPEQLRWINIWRSAGLDIKVLGEQPAEYISQIFCSASLGISTTPIILAEKSGSIAAMREHGLRVLCLSRHWSPVLKINYIPPSGVMEYQTGRLKECFEGTHEILAKNTVNNIALKFSASLIQKYE